MSVESVESMCACGETHSECVCRDRACAERGVRVSVRVCGERCACACACVRREVRVRRGVRVRACVRCACACAERGVCACVCGERSVCADRMRVRRELRECECAERVCGRRAF